MFYTLKNTNYTLNINSFGAELKSAKFQDEEYLHEGDDVYWAKSSPILFPIVGKLKDDKFIHDSKTYTMEKHGFARTSEFVLESQDNNKITFSLKENDETLKHYPFKFTLSITYVLHENYFEIIYNIKSSQNILFSIGAHPAFKLHASLDKSYLEFEKEELSHLYCLDLDNGCILGTKENYLNSKVLKLQKDTFKNDALIFKGLKSNSVQLKNTQNSNKVKVDFKGFSNMGFWAPVGAPFVCIEPWCGIADDINTNHELNQKDSIEFLKKDNEFSRSMQITLS